MRYFLIILLGLLNYSSIVAQIHFKKFKTPDYKSFSVQRSTYSADSTLTEEITFDKVKSLKGIAIHLQHMSRGNPDSARMLIYKNGKLLQTLSFPFDFWWLEECLVADLDRNHEADIKFIIGGPGSGLAGEMAYKIYLFKFKNKFRILSFFDFSHEKEYDLNNDGLYEILSRDHIFYKNHSYWVFNAFNFRNGKLVNVSKSINYPLWTRYLYLSSDKIARGVSLKERMKYYIDIPGETIIR